MLARRLIPCLDVAGGRVVKGVHFRELRDAGDPVDQAARYDAAGADEVVLLDIDASPEERGTLIDLVSRVADRLFVPFTVGGAVRIPVIASGGAGTLEHLAAALDAGAHGVLAATLFHYRGMSIPEARAYLASRGYSVRP